MAPYGIVKAKGLLCLVSAKYWAKQHTFPSHPASKGSSSGTRRRSNQGLRVRSRIGRQGKAKRQRDLRGYVRWGGRRLGGMQVGDAPGLAGGYQTRQELAGYIGCPLLQPKALPNSSKFWTLPLVRQRPGEWGSVRAIWRAEASVWFWHQTWAKPRK